jgi:hypothetical protein
MLLLHCVNPALELNVCRLRAKSQAYYPSFFDRNQTLRPNQGSNDSSQFGYSLNRLKFDKKNCKTVHVLQAFFMVKPPKFSQLPVFTVRDARKKLRFALLFEAIQRNKTGERYIYLRIPVDGVGVGLSFQTIIPILKMERFCRT